MIKIIVDIASVLLILLSFSILFSISIFYLGTEQDLENISRYLQVLIRFLVSSVFSAGVVLIIKILNIVRVKLELEKIPAGKVFLLLLLIAMCLNVWVWFTR